MLLNGEMSRIFAAVVTLTDVLAIIVRKSDTDRGHPRLIYASFLIGCRWPFFRDPGQAATANPLPRKKGSKKAKRPKR